MPHDQKVIDQVVNKLINDDVADKYYCQNKAEAEHYKARYRAEIKRMIENIGVEPERYLKMFDERWEKGK